MFCSPSRGLNMLGLECFLQPRQFPLLGRSGTLNVSNALPSEMDVTWRHENEFLCID